MDCIQAQAIISEALDGNPVDSAALETAKRHCRDCEQCGQYVRALNAIRRAVPPQPPADLPDRVMAAVRAESEAVAVAAQEGGGAASGLTAVVLTDALSSRDTDAAVGDPFGEADAVHSEAVPSGSTAPPESRISLGGGRMDRRQFIAWGSAAAVLLVVVGISAALGIMRLVNGEATRTASTDATTMAAPESAAKLGADAGAAGTTAEDATIGGAPGAESAASGNVYVVFAGSVYLMQAADAPPAPELNRAGQASVTFDPNISVTSRDVLKGDEANVIYIADDAQKLQPFVAVRRIYGGATYSLQSADITAYGQWPTLPPGISRPVPENNLEGLPVFALDGRDASGTAVYRQVGADRRIGIAIPPGTSTDDAAAGNPNWTWWTPSGP